MITTEREYRITKARIANPEQGLANVRARTDLAPRMRQAYVDALTSNIEEMAAEVRAYEGLKAGRVQIRSASLAELPTVLIRARIAHGWTQKQLAAFLSVTEQTIQRFLLTADRKMPAQQNIPASGLAVVLVPGNRMADIRPRAADIQAVVQAAKPGTVTRLRSPR
jgi:Helix-turn-helix.